MYYLTSKYHDWFSYVLMFQPADVLINAYSVIYKQVRLDRIITHIASGLFFFG